jgi:hypothetical protein
MAKDEVLEYLQSHPGKHSKHDIADGITAHGGGTALVETIAKSLKKLYRDKSVSRQRQKASNMPYLYWVEAAP